MIRHVCLAMAGFGSVGRGLARLLLDLRNDMAARHGVEFDVTAITTGSHGSITDDRGIDLEWALAVDRLGPSRPIAEIIRDAGADVLVELTPLDVDNGEPARSHVELALRQNMHVVTANKGPIAFAYAALASLARERDRRLLFESTVMDGTPVFNLARYGLLGARVTGFRGVLNSTTNYVIHALENGGTLDTAVREAQQKGFAEADPSMDLDGWDAAAKTAALANVLLSADLTPHHVQRTGIGALTGPEVRQAVGNGQRYKLVCEGRCTGDRVVARVQPELVPHATPIGQVEGTSSVLVVSTDLMGDITIVENDPTLVQTAYGVLNDLLEIFSLHAQ